MPAVRRHHDVDVEITNDVSVSALFDGHEIDIPRSASLPLAVDDNPVRLYESDPTGIRKAHAEIEQDDRPLEECSSRPRLETDGIARRLNSAGGSRDVRTCGG